MVASIINKSQLEGAHRIDAEYYKPEYLEILKRLNTLKTVTLGEFCKISDGKSIITPGVK